MTRYFIIGAFVIALSGCATILNDATALLSISFSDGSNGECSFRNKRTTVTMRVPSTVTVSRSDDFLTYDCTTDDGRKANGAIPSTIGTMIWGNIVFGGVPGAIIDSATDQHREYPPQFVIPVGS